MSSNPQKLGLLLFAILGGVAVLALLIERQTSHQVHPAPAKISMAGMSPENHASNQITTAAASVKLSADFLKQASEKLKGLDANGAREELEALRAALAAMPTNEAVALIRQFLDSKADAPTHLGFKIAGHGWLDEAPTMRTFLLDELGRIDPAAAADYARVILANMDSPDEWAVALRNLARGDDSDAARQLLEEKTSEMLQYQPWQQNPSSGFLEAFDVAVYLGGTSLLPMLTGLVEQQGNPAIGHASYLALDRLVINAPATTLNALLANMNSMQGRELTRADYFSRADVSDPQQRQILENYLLNPNVTPPELNAFANIFPNENFMISPNLLTQSPAISHEALVSRDKESLQVMQEWLADPRFAGVRPVLEIAASRLEGFVKQEDGK